MKNLYSRKYTNQVIYLQRIFSIFEPCLVVVPVIEMHKWKSIYRIVQYISNSFLLALKLPLLDDVNFHCLQTGIYCGLHGGYYIFRFAHHCVLPLLKVKTLPQMKSYRCSRITCILCQIRRHVWNSTTFMWMSIDLCCILNVKIMNKFNMYNAK